jgi:predicted TIM-barrel enzyme
MIIIYNSVRYRMAGRGSLAGLMPYGNANDVVLEMVSGDPYDDFVLY